MVYLHSLKISMVTISHWVIENVKSMEGTFYASTNFNCDVSRWDVQNVTNMECIFKCTINFCADISG